MSWNAFRVDGINERENSEVVLIHSVSWNAFRGHPLGTCLNTGFQKAFFNQPILSTTSRRLFLEEFSLTRWYNERWPNRFLPSFLNYCSKVLPWRFYDLNIHQFYRKMRLVWLDCTKIPGCGAEDWKAFGTILRFWWLWALFVGFGFVGRFCVADEVSTGATPRS